jgi:hypothetical protein
MCRRRRHVQEEEACAGGGGMCRRRRHGPGENLAHVEHELDIVARVTYAVAATGGYKLGGQVGVAPGGEQRGQVFRRKRVVFLVNKVMRQLPSARRAHTIWTNCTSGQCLHRRSSTSKAALESKRLLNSQMPLRAEGSCKSPIELSWFDPNHICLRFANAELCRITAATLDSTWSPRLR